MIFNNVVRVFTRNGGASMATMRRCSIAKPIMGYQSQCFFSTQNAQRTDRSVYGFRSNGNEQVYESEVAASDTGKTSDYSKYVQDARDDLNSPSWGSEQTTNSAEWQA
ncbi:stress responsive orphan 1 [Schizosaccharomyces cryophilus OY26]|uniref:Stress responsive orphan 1 n=1 Tax=Schizosaccharomyces cryophilus (strain OY26 / ATCC MYA-4695 / CBS 11777 / NBRC 106824 / NRRL Y48691) TaxID=653667 RepID=S9W6P0_SCHCR|nr:stress responsive orphan 1 [Schizosaccharomyces cryophilus OY26]EPY53520.1 stress responsive orphan 1 [Schizosaccharomyces cryophilus OY26]